MSELLELNRNLFLYYATSAPNCMLEKTISFIFERSHPTKVESMTYSQKVVVLVEASILYCEKVTNTSRIFTVPFKKRRQSINYLGKRKDVLA